MARDTRQRRVIRDVLLREARALSPAQILELARNDQTGLGIATVYRTLRTLIDAGEARSLDLPGAGPLYESTGIGHHHHFHCRACGRVFELEGCVHGIAPLLPPGFTMEEHEIIIKGLCSTCQRTTAPADGVHG